MKKTVALLLSLIILLLALAGCAEPSNAPAGMQLVRGSDALGYYFYVPDGWTLSSQGNIAAAYVSTIDNTSVTLVEAKMPEVSIAEYFEASRADFTFPINVTKENHDFKLGNAEESKQFIYDYEYSGYKFRTMQVFAKFEGRFYIFTFTAQLTERQGGSSFYDFHLESSLPSITENIKFVGKSGTNPSPEYPEADGLILVSNKGLCGFDLYVPKEYSVDFSDGIVSASREDGANITVAKATMGGVPIDEYWNIRKGELEAIFGAVTEIEIKHKSGSLGNLSQNTTSSFEYSYSHGDVTYHVYQLLGVDAFSGYVFTFTAPESVYGERIGEAIEIASRINFK